MNGLEASLPAGGAWRRRTAVSLLALMLLAAGLTLAGCGSSGSEADSGPAGDRTVESRSVPAGAGFNPGRIFDEVIDGVVTIRAVYKPESSQADPEGAGGSGFVLDGNGEVITNAHVVSEETAGRWVPVAEVFVEFASGDVVPAEVVGTDLFSDVALLKVDPSGLELKPLPLADSSEVTVGEPVAVVGSPFGENQTLTTGIVSQTGRSVRSLTDFEIMDAIQTDAPINPGNSGGPMLNRAGEVIAISQQMKSESGSSSGIGFGVPANAVRRSADQLREDGRASYSYIGISTEALYPQLAAKLRLKVKRGAIVSQILDDGPADRAGLKGGDTELFFQGRRHQTGGDVIVGMDGQEVTEPEDLSRITANLKPGDTVEVELLRGGKRLKVKLKLGERPEQVARQESGKEQPETAP